MESQQAQPYRADIDGLRAVAVLAVMLFHSGWPALSGGFVGVDVFFVISGYLITNLIATEIGEQRFSMARFYARRIRRILPALVAVLTTITVLSFGVLTPGSLYDYGISVIAAALMVANVYYYLQSGYFAGPSDQMPLLHTWSLSAEEQFYMLWPLFFATLMAKRRRRDCRAVCAFLFCVSLLGSAWAARAAPEAGFYLLPTRAWELLLGALAAIKAFPVPRTARVAATTSFIGLAAVVGASCAFSPATRIPGVAALVPTCGALLILLSGTEQRPLVNRILGSRPLVLMGLCSYSLYLWHWPLLVLTGIYRNRELAAAEVASVLGASVLISFVSWRYIEQPFRRRASSPRSIRAALTAGPVALIACVGLGAGAMLLPPWGLEAGDHRIAAAEMARKRINPLKKGLPRLPPHSSAGERVQLRSTARSRRPTGRRMGGFACRLFGARDRTAGREGGIYRSADHQDVLPSTAGRNGRIQPELRPVQRCRNGVPRDRIDGSCGGPRRTLGPVRRHDSP